MTKKQKVQAQRAEWRQMLADGRVVRVLELENQLTGYPTVERVLAAIETAREAGLTAEIVKVEINEGVTNDTIFPWPCLFLRWGCVELFLLVRSEQ